MRHQKILSVRGLITTLAGAALAISSSVAMADAPPPSPVPEPGLLPLLAMGAMTVLLAGIVRRRKK